MPFDSQQEQGSITLSAIRRLYRRNARLTGTQTSTIIVRGIATGHVNISEVSSVIMKEVSIGVILGGIYGLLLGLLTYAQYSKIGDPIMLSLAVGLSVLFSMFIACLVASFIPILLYKLDFDPAISTGPFVTTPIDIIGVLGYFIIAQNLFIIS